MCIFTKGKIQRRFTEWLGRLKGDRHELAGMVKVIYDACSKLSLFHHLDLRPQCVEILTKHFQDSDIRNDRGAAGLRTAFREIPEFMLDFVASLIEKNVGLSASLNRQTVPNVNSQLEHYRFEDIHCQERGEYYGGWNNTGADRFELAKMEAYGLRGVGPPKVGDW